MKYARVSLVVATDDESDSCISQVLEALISKDYYEDGLVILEHAEENMYLMTDKDLNCQFPAGPVVSGLRNDAVRLRGEDRALGEFDAPIGAR